MMTRLLILAASVALAPVATAADPYIRIAEEDDAVALQIALRTLERGPDEPRITLVGVAHVADRAYYDELQAHLDSHDLVLFEGVGPLWARLPHDASDADRARATRARLRALAVEIEARRRDHLTTESIDDLLDERTGYDARLLRQASVDAWSRPFIQSRSPDGSLSLRSLGADNAPGGTGPARDLSSGDLAPLTDEELEHAEGIQATLAKAAGLVFQLTAIDYDKPHWRNSDTTAEALSFALAGLDPADARPGSGEPAAGGGGDPLMQTLRGEGAFGRLAGGMLRLMGSSPRSSAFLRLMLVETLARADDLMDAAQGMGVKGLDRMMQVLLTQRNAVVLADLERALQEDAGDDPNRTIAVFYGAAHLPEMEENLVAIGFRPTATAWLDAIRVAPDETGVSRDQISQARAMIARMLSVQAAPPNDRPTPP